MKTWIAIVVLVLWSSSGCGSKEKEQPNEEPKPSAADAAVKAAPAPDAAPVAGAKPSVRFTEVESMGTQPETIGLPAIREDGKEIALVLVQRSDDAGENGATLAFLDATTGKIARQLPLIGDDIQDKWTDDEGKVTAAYRAKVDEQTAAANAALAEQTWRPLTVAEPVGADEGTVATIGDLGFAQDDELGAVVVSRAGQQVGRLDPTKVLEFPKQPKDPECAIRGAMMRQVMFDATTSVAAIEFRFAEGHHCIGYGHQVALLKLNPRSP